MVLEFSIALSHHFFFSQLYLQRLFAPELNGPNRCVFPVHSHAEQGRRTDGITSLTHPSNTRTWNLGYFDYVSSAKRQNKTTKALETNTELLLLVSFSQCYELPVMKLGLQIHCGYGNRHSPCWREEKQRWKGRKPERNLWCWVGMGGTSVSSGFLR